jgi:hypothetical protein
MATGYTEALPRLFATSMSAGSRAHSLDRANGPEHRLVDVRRRYGYLEGAADAASGAAAALAVQSFASGFPPSICARTSGIGGPP